MVAELTITAKQTENELEAAGPVGQAHTYGEVRGYPNATSVSYGGTIGQAAEGAVPWPYYQFFLWRGGLFFLTSGLAGAIITAAKLVLHETLGGKASAIHDSETQYLVIVPGDVCSETGLVAADYGELLNVTTQLGSIKGQDWLDYGDGADVPIDLNAEGLARINVTGWTKLALRGLHDINNVPDSPIERNRFDFKNTNDVVEERRPRLVITYQASTPPTVKTLPATEVGLVAATLNGTLDNDGSEPCECAFEWGLDTGYGVTTPIQIRTTGQTFSQVIHELVPGTTYHFRAKATNSLGTSYGADRSFSTKLVISRAYALAREEL